MSQDEGQKSSPIFISLIPHLMGGEGHIIPYHQAVNQAIKKIGWQHNIIIPTDHNLNNIPSQWCECLSPYDLEAEGNGWQKILRIQQTWELSITIVNYLRNKVINQSDLSIIFLERFIHLQLLALVIALYLVPTKNLSVWLLYRRDTHKDKTKFIYKWLNNLVKKRLSKGRFKLLTDSDLLGQSLSNYFEESVIVMPIPHTDIDCYSMSITENDDIVCWWPGSPREEKGWEVINNLVNSDVKLTQNICLIASEKSKLEVPENGLKVKLVEDNLSRDKYHSWFCLTNIILLPYDAEAYGERTSGIFTESIIAGKISLVTPNTWMAYELLKYNLSELVIDWQEGQKVFDIVIKVSKSPIIKDKIKAMQTSYQQFHCLDNYGCMIQKIIKEMV
ncbi:glycosyltransferase family 1 protein [Aphanothece sacrum]|uniref:Glycosyltransferase n=1 Tax=Aphanothece sacrum FPU1 TaxID=1920663 RepID=A0A401IJU6_APHSA|nr:glycosyltransferase family 1 protein [Aphanothece sacrum]GBF81573.1 hypothetical protein AsFPU1_2987 [Aphanothece sacrum FPU1]GBF86970.1 hypothetical protein AsFPU3_4049 [Aphanothece sacrum FPU3]